jgi:hypothetical protein
MLRTMRTLLPVLVLLALLTAGCGSKRSAKPTENPRVAAARVLDQIVHNHYTDAWGDLHSVDQRVAPLAEYVACETRSPVIARPRSVKVVSVNSESVGLGDGKFVQSTAVDIRMAFAGSFSLVHTIHLVAEDGKWKWILPSWRFRDYKADRCPTDSGSTPPPANA